MKKFLFVLVLLASLVVSAFGQTNLFSFEVKDLSYTTNTGYYSKYVGGTGGVLFTNKPVWQSSIVISHKSGAYLLVWQSLPANAGHDWDTFARERDVIFGWNGNVFGDKINVDVSGGVYDLVPTSNLYPVNVTASWNPGKIHFYGSIEHDFAQHDDLPAGTVYRFGAKFAIHSIDIDAGVLGNAGSHPYGGNADTVSGGRLVLSHGFVVSKGTLTPSLGYVAPFGHADGLVKNQFIAGVGYAIKL